MKIFPFPLLIILFSGVLLPFGLVSCGGKREQKADANPKNTLRIAVIPKGSTHTHWKSVHAGAEEAAKELGVEVIWQGPQKEDDRQMQIQTVQNFVSRGVDAIALAPLDDRALMPSVQAAKRRDIPVIIFDSRLQGNDFAAYVATDNYKGGQLCASRLAEVMGDKGKVVMLKYSEGSAATLEREAGFMNEIKKHPQIQIISDNQYAGATMEKAFQVSQNLLNRFGAEAEGIFCSNESATQGMLRALQLAGKAGKVKFVGFDINKTLYEAVKSGQVQGVAVQDPVKMGYVKH